MKGDSDERTSQGTEASCFETSLNVSTQGLTEFPTISSRAIETSKRIREIGEVQLRKPQFLLLTLQSQSFAVFRVVCDLTGVAGKYPYVRESGCPQSPAGPALMPRRAGTATHASTEQFHG